MSTECSLCFAEYYRNACYQFINDTARLILRDDLSKSAEIRHLLAETLQGLRQLDAVHQRAAVKGGVACEAPRAADPAMAFVSPPAVPLAPVSAALDRPAPAVIDHTLLAFSLLAGCSGKDVSEGETYSETWIRRKLRSLLSTMVRRVTEELRREARRLAYEFTEKVNFQRLRSLLMEYRAVSRTCRSSERHLSMLERLAEGRVQANYLDLLVQEADRRRAHEDWACTLEWERRKAEEVRLRKVLRLRLNTRDLIKWDRRSDL